MTGSDSVELNAFGKIAAGSALLGIGTLVVGGVEYAMYVGVCFGVAALSVAWAMRRDGGRSRTRDRSRDQRDERRETREKEVEAFEDGFS